MAGIDRISALNILKYIGFPGRISKLPALKVVDVRAASTHVLALHEDCCQHIVFIDFSGIDFLISHDATTKNRTP